MKIFLLSAVCLASLTNLAYAQGSLFDKNNEVVVEEKEDVRVTYEKNKFESRIKTISETEKPIYKNINQMVEKMPPREMKLFIEYNEMTKQDMARSEDKPVPKEVKINSRDKKQSREYMYDNFSTGAYDDLISEIEDEAKKAKEE